VKFEDLSDTYKVKELYYTLQGEGAQTGRAAVFLRFTGCNLWTGLEKDREKAICQFCDTDFVGMDGENGGKYTADELVALILRNWPDSDTRPFVVATGGEPMLQLDEHLLEEMHDKDIELAIETNGTISLIEGLDWVCVSPKAGAELKVRKGHELKLVHPQKHLDPQTFVDMDFEHFYLQPMDGDQIQENIAACIDYCRRHPKWKLSMQSHKLIGLP